MKKKVPVLTTFILGAIILYCMDTLIGIRLEKDVGVVFTLIHKIAYMAWGGIIFKLAKRLEK